MKNFAIVAFALFGLSAVGCQSSQCASGECSSGDKMACCSGSDSTCSTCEAKTSEYETCPAGYACAKCESKK